MNGWGGHRPPQPLQLRRRDFASPRRAMPGPSNFVRNGAAAAVSMMIPMREDRALPSGAG